MIESLERRLKQKLHHLRGRRGSHGAVPLRLVVSKAKWLHDARSPVTLMIDDLTNAWHGSNGGDLWEPGGDWGGGYDAEGSALRFLEERLLQDYPEVRTTFFTVAGPISAYTHHQPFSHTAPLDANPESARFFASLALDPRFELAYHGYNHGTPGERTETFIQEWRGFQSVSEAVTQTKNGLSIFSRVGTVPSGGKYGGWEYNQFAEEAVDSCGFLWWCRDWMPRDVSGSISNDYYEPQFFGRHFVVALPSTVHGHYWDPRQVDLLLARRQMIAIEEHIAPVRPDGLVQTPNIVDDMPELRRLFQHLRNKSVWHATSGDVAKYVIGRDRSFIYDVTRDGFSLRYDGRVERPMLTLVIDCSAVCSPDHPGVTVTMPDGETVPSESCVIDTEQFRHTVTISVMQGRYTVEPGAIGQRHSRGT